MDKLKTRILLISVLLLLLFSVQSVAAISDNDGNLTSESIDLSICDNTDDVSSDELSNNPGDVLSASNELDVLSADEVPYSELDSEISVGGNVELQHDYYICSGGESTITISGDNRIIDGRGAVIDMAGSTIRAFYVSGSGITIKNLTIKNVNFNGDGGAIYFSNSGTVENCNFTDNNATYGGAVYFSNTGTVSNCNFANNNATGTDSWGGAIMFVSDGTVTNCNFTGNTATRDGGAIRFTIRGTVIKCNFTNNTVSQRGGAIFFSESASSGTVEDCNFTNNHAISGSGGAVCFYVYSTGLVKNCNFINNSASDSGAIRFIREATVKNCNFTNNTARLGGAIRFETGTVENCNFTNNHATITSGSAVYCEDANVTNCTFTDNSAHKYGGAIYFLNQSTVEDCNFTNNTASGDGGAVYFLNTGTVTNCNFIGNNATYYGGAVCFWDTGEVRNCNFTGNNANTGSAIYFYSTSATKTVSNSRFLNNRANAEALEVTKNDNNITITFTGKDNLLNAIYSRNDAEVTFTNVTYWSANGIATTGSSAIKPSRSNKEAGQNITVGVVVNGELVLSGVYLTDENGMIVLDIRAGENYFIGARHDTDSYYTEAEKTISNNTKFGVNVTSQTTNNRTVNITAKSNIPNEIIDGKLLFIVPNSDPINATYAGNGTWWAVHTFDDYRVYEINASYTGLDNVTVNNGTVTISKANSTISAENKTVTYPGDIVLVTSGENCTGINKSSVVIRNPDGTAVDANVIVEGFTITISGLGAGNYTVYYNNTVNSDWNGAGNFTGITVLKANSSVKAEDVEVTYGDAIEVIVTSENATKVSYQIISSGTVVKEGTVNVGENIKGLDLAAGEYTVNLTTIVNRNYTTSNYTSKITVKPANSTVKAEDVEVTYGDAIEVIVTSENATSVSYQIIGKEGIVKEDTVNVGENITGLNLAAGEYTVNLTTMVNNNYTTSNYTSKITVKPANSSVSAEDAVASFGDAVSIPVSSVNATEVSYKIIDANDKAVVNGTVKPGSPISVSDLAAGDYTVSLTTVVDENHTSVSNSSKLHIKHVVSIIIAPVTGYAGEVISFTAQFKYENGDLVDEGATGLTIRYEEREILAASMYSILSADESSPVSNGKATFNVKLGDPGIYPYVVSYSGGDADDVEAESTLTILKVNTTVSGVDVSGKPADKKDVTVTVTDQDNNPVANGTVTLTLNGQDYNASVENGKAVLSIELPNPGSYNATVTYNGNDYYNSSSSSISVDVEKVNTNAPSTEDVSGNAGEKTDIKVKFVDENGNPVKNGTATLTVDGKTYTAEVINGVATFKDVVIPEKDTVADVYYQGNDYYNASSTTISIKVKQNNTEPDNNGTDDNKTTKHVSSKAVDTNATGNPIAVMLLALCALVITYRKR